MKPELENIQIEGNNQSYQYFKRSNTSFLPFWHYHPELELTLISKGSGTRFIGDSIQPFSDFDLVLVGENLPHHWVSGSIENNQEAYVFQFKSSLFESFVECDEFSSLFNRAKRGLFFTKPDRKLIEKITAFDDLSSLSRISALIEILQQLLYSEKTQVLSSENYLNRIQGSGSQSKISKTTNYILEHLDEPLSVQHLADYTHMVPQSFCRWFKKHSGHSFVSFLNKSRIERVCHQLRTTSHPIQHIAFESGFESLSHFNRTFKKLKRCSPKDFRKLGKSLLNQKPN